MKYAVPPSTQVLLIIAVFTAFLVFAGEIPGWLTLGALIYIGLKVHSYYSNWCKQLDDPPPKLYALPAEAVWAQVEEACKVLKTNWKHVTIAPDYSNPEPPPGQPIFYQATFFIYHPYLEDIKKYLSSEHQDLRSRVIFKAYIEKKGYQCELKIKCETHPILSRFVENNVIQTITAKIDELVIKHLPPPKP
jgi:hypothetical protein